MISDVTLRDGWHMFDYKIPIEFIKEYSKFAEKSKIDVLEVGHGLSIGCKEPRIHIDDIELIDIARKELKNTKLSTLVNPDFCNLEYACNVTKDVDIIRLSCIPSETYKLENFIKMFKDLGKEIWISLLFTSKFSDYEVLEACKKLQDKGIKTIIIFDTAGNYKPDDVKRRFIMLKNCLKDVKFGFHGHNNLGLANANTMVALKYGAEIADVSLHGIGGGSGNAQLEVIGPIYSKTINHEEIFKMNDSIDYFPRRQSINIQNALNNYSPFFKNF